MEAYTTHSLLEYARDFDHLLTMKKCEYTYPQRDILPYTWRYDPNTSIGTILSASSFKGISFTHSGYMPVLEVIDGNETNETDNETREMNEVHYYVGDHCAFCFEKKGLGFPLNHDIKSTYRGGIEMLEKIDRLKFHQRMKFTLLCRLCGRKMRTGLSGFLRMVRAYSLVEWGLKSCRTV